MRFLTPFVVLPLMLLFVSSNANWAAQRDLGISGRLIFDNANVSCYPCLVALLANGVRPVGTTYADLSGHFTFTGVPRGSYTIHVELDGFQDVNQVIEAGYGEANVIVTLVRKPAVVSTGSPIVNIAHFND